MSQLINAELVDLDLTAGTKEEATRSLAERMSAQGRVTDLDGFLEDVAAREARMPTGLEGGIGIPHCRSAHVTEPTLAFGRPAVPVDFGASDGPADLIFLIAAPEGGDRDHLGILSGLARRLADESFTAQLRSVPEPERAAALIRGDAEAEAGAEAAPEAAPVTREAAAADTGARETDATPDDAPHAGAEPGPARDSAGRESPDREGERQGRPGEAPGAEGQSSPFRIVAVTSCPTGIAHTFMAAESLTRAGQEAGVEVVVETQGSAGFDRLDPAVIAAADGVIFAHDVEVREKHRFAGKPTVDVGVKAAVNRPAELVAEVRARAAHGGTSAAGAPPVPMRDAGDPGDGFGTQLRKWLMTGVSYMVPFVAAGGLLIALSFALGGYEITDAKSVADHFVWTEAHSWAALLNQTGGLAFSFLVPVLAGYIAYGMADRPGLVPGFVGGAVAVEIEAGFLGGLVAGLLAGAVAMSVQRVTIPPALRGIMPVVVIPLISSVIVGTLMFVLIGTPIASAQKAMTDWLGGLTGTDAALLGLLIGLMMCFDLGGPVNKVAYTFATGGIATADPGNGSLTAMAAAMGAGMVPPLGMALATVVRSKLFTRAERENGKAAWVLGASFITEGAIPFAAADPLRVIPSSMAGGAVTGALTMSFGSTLRAPHGGVFVVPLIGSPLLYLVAVAAGTAVTTALVLVLKGARGRGGSAPASTEPAGRRARTAGGDGRGNGGPDETSGNASGPGDGGVRAPA
ncbi:fructose-specific PTS transporter subunit EIIC [Streptomyces ovatisporus]|uniref:Fructose-specific PTS transporter subunit EIIC n=1 Tax=Streptomyces ovatisporus TaxID=1128682 RepID=A0ABV9A6Z4_9ACTN